MTFASRAAVVAATIVLAGCNSAASVDIAGEGIDVPVEALVDLLGEADTPRGLTADPFWFYAPIGEEAPEKVAYFAPAAFDPSECAAAALFVELLSVEDTAQITDEFIIYGVEYGVAFGDQWTLAAAVFGRNFPTSEDAARFLAAGRDSVEPCKGGYTFTSPEGEVFAVGSVTASEKPTGYPPEVAVLYIETTFPKFGSVTKSAFIQYGNTVFTVRLTDDSSIVQPPDRVHEIAITVANKLVALAQIQS